MSPHDPQKTLQILDDGKANGARAHELATLLGVDLTTLQRWRRQFFCNGGISRRKSSLRNVAHRLSEEEHRRILLTSNK